MHLGLDIDDTITHAPEFFRMLTHAMPDARVTILTYRDEVEPARLLLDRLGIRYDRLIVSSDPQFGVRSGQDMGPWKAMVIRQLAIDVYFDDMPEIVHLVEPPTKVFMCCDDMMRLWIREQL